MKYIAWISLIFSLLMATLDPRPIWWILSGCGTVANVLVCGMNGWKMPVWRLKEEGVRHTPMTSATRLKFLGDVIPTGLGTASIGDFLLIAGLMGVWAHKSTTSYVAMIVGAGYWVWSSGYSGGFQLFRKWDKEERRDCRKNIPILALLMLAGNLLNVRGCGGAEMKASVKDIVPEISAVKTTPIAQSHYRSLGKVSISPPPLQDLRRLKREVEKEEKDRKKALENLAKLMPQVQTVTVNGQTMRFVSQMPQHPHDAKGPYCRVTCTVHHDAHYDVEIEKDFCRAGVVPPETTAIAGWADSHDGKTEFNNYWPGPAGGGFKTYKLYWK